MLEPVIKSVEESFEKFSLGRLVYVCFLVALLGGGAYVYNSSTGYSTYTRVEKQIGALERLKALEDRGIKKSPELAPIYAATVASLRPQKEAARYAPDWDAVIKFASATCVPMAFAFAALVSLLRGKRDALSMFGGAATTVLFLGVPTLFIPTLFNSVAFTSGVFFIGQIAFIWWFVGKYKSRVAAA